MRIRQNPLWLWNPEETSPEIQNRGTSGPKIGHVSDKKALKKKKKKKKESINFYYKVHQDIVPRIYLGWGKMSYSSF